MNATTNELALVTDTQVVTVVPLDSVQTVAVADVKSWGYWTYVGVAVLLGALVAVLSNRLAPGAFWAGVALGAAVTLMDLLALWLIPGVRRALVVWRSVYERDS